MCRGEDDRVLPADLENAGRGAAHAKKGQEDAERRLEPVGIRLGGVGQARRAVGLADGGVTRLGDSVQGHR